MNQQQLKSLSQIKNAEEISCEAKSVSFFINIDSLKGRYVLEKYFEPQKSLKRYILGSNSYSWLIGVQM
jgi:hypothetical protein